MKQKKQRYIRKGRKYEISEVLPYIGDYKRKYDGDLIKMNSQRYQVFRKSCKCVTCGIEGQYFVKENNTPNEVYHFNLYAINEQGEEVMMTKDHIVPKSKGGANELYNYQTMCEKCNMRKGNKIEG